MYTHTHIHTPISIHIGKSQKVDQEPAKEIPLGWYDCGDGFYNPDNRVVYDYDVQFLRNAGTYISIQVLLSKLCTQILMNMNG